MSCKSFLDCLNYLKQKREKASHKCKQKGSRADSAGGFPGCPCGDLSRSKRCIDYADTRSKASCSENNKTYTLDKTGDDFQTICMHVDGGIVNSSSAPRIRSTPEYTRLQKWCMDHDGNLKMGERTFLEKYAELDKLK